MWTPKASQTMGRVYPASPETLDIGERQTGAAERNTEPCGGRVDLINAWSRNGHARAHQGTKASGDTHARTRSGGSGHTVARGNVTCVKIHRKGWDFLFFSAFFNYSSLFLFLFTSFFSFFFFFLPPASFVFFLFFLFYLLFHFSFFFYFFFIVLFFFLFSSTCLSSIYKIELNAKLSVTTWMDKQKPPVNAIIKLTREEPNGLFSDSQ